jgi:hypothetical protein
MDIENELTDVKMACSSSWGYPDYNSRKLEQDGTLTTKYTPDSKNIR